MPLITFITSYRNDPSPNRGRNQLNIIEAFGERDWNIAEISHESVHARDNRIFGFDEADNESNRQPIDIMQSELVWMFGFGPKESFLDRMQVLNALPPRMFVNSVDAFVYRHGKQGILFSNVSFNQPRSIVSDRPEILHSLIQEGGDWVVKPSAGSFGIGVCLINKDDPNAKSIIELSTQNGFALLQERVDTQREKRWLVANGRIIGVYAKQLDGHRGNLGAGMQPREVAHIADEEEELIAKAVGDLMDIGIRYAAIDVAFPYVLDVNFVNPGWLSSYQALTGKNLAQDVAAAFTD